MKAPLFVILAVVAAASVSAQSGTTQAPRPAAPPAAAGAKPPADQPLPEGIIPPPDYVIGAEDVLEVIVWREKDLSAEVMVRPDGLVSLPLLNDVQAGGLTPEQFRLRVTTAVGKFVEAPSVTVIVKTINSRKVFVMGEVVKPGTYPLTAPTTVLQLLGAAGGPTAFADSKDISIVRTIGEKTVRLPFNYKEVARGRKMEQNVMLRPGDTVIIP
jgi:polysaccharide export outer membrane protein